MRRSIKEKLEEQVDREVLVAVKTQPFPEQGPTGVNLKFAEKPGTLVEVFDDGIAIRAGDGELVFRWEEFFYVAIVSPIATLTKKIVTSPR